MATIAELQSQLDELKKAYRSGALEVTYDGKSIKYKSQTEMQAAIASLQAELGMVQGRSIRVVSDKGW
jgi:hypothetical protein